MDLARHEIHHEDGVDELNTSVRVAKSRSTDTESTQQAATSTDSGVSTAPAGEQSSDGSTGDSVLESITEEFDDV